MLGPVAAQVSGMAFQPCPGLGIKPLKNIRIGGEIARLRLLTPGFPASGARTRFLNRSRPGIGTIIAAAIMASFGGRHGSTSCLPAGRHHACAARKNGRQRLKERPAETSVLL